MTNIMPVLQMLGLPATSGTAEVIEAIRAIQRQVDTQTRRGNAMEEAWKTEHARVKRAEDPDNWRAVWTGDDSTADVETTAMVHGNLISLDQGPGQFLLYFRPCCQNLRCECIQRRSPGGYCVCHDNDE
ncbi:hypothetical protein PP631_gp073 [Streptomyces phage KimJongPhill]|jgi:hypothetical protein|uniref:Uncharacterized protein n=1 Tax=Streptomyces phage KimJongPhill TaxID=2848886 RepID=A0A8F2IWB3_9CAUD|nr:hypothetical protein PP631_gp073 [Streptomyces phage KimJongPhill]QWT29854.1 hypothetical protein SEA_KIMJONGPHILL_73 [Streptomyces phage KimJongPhill]